MDEDALTRGHAGDAGECEGGHRRVGDGRDGEGGIDAVALRGYDEGLVADEHRGIPSRAGGGERDHLLADREAGHPVAERAYRARDLKTGNERRLGQPLLVLEQPLAEEDVDEPDGRVGDVDRDLSGPGFRIGQIDDAQHARVAESCEVNGFHAWSFSFALVRVLSRWFAHDR